MVKKLTKHGNSLALVIEKPVLELLNIQADTPLEVSTDGHSLVITPQEPGSDQSKRVQEALKKVNSRYSNALRALGQ